MKSSDTKILSVEPEFKSEFFRTPLKFGVGIIKDITLFSVKVRVMNRKGNTAEGKGCILLSDLWAWPGDIQLREKKQVLLKEICKKFCSHLSTNYDSDFAHPIDIYLSAVKHLNVIARQIDFAEPVPELALMMCGSPIDAALHDAFGKVNSICSYAGYGAEYMNYDLSHYLGDKFKNKFISDYIHNAYTPKLPIFHLVGGVDKLYTSELTDSDPQDGLPVSLEQWITKQGIYCFKIKLSGNNINWDVNRTIAITNLAKKRLGNKQFFLSCDPNEQSETPESVVEYLKKLNEESNLAYERLLYIEQPVSRDLKKYNYAMRPVSALKPVLIDESVTSIDKIDLAYNLGWSGVALKTCKGHSETLLCLVKAKELGMVYSVQDLTNPGIAFIHSAGLATRINPILGVEYNARQYLPYTDQETQEKHQSLFKVANGEISTSSIDKPGLGYS